MDSIIPEKLDEAGTHALVIGVSRYPYVKDAPEETVFGEQSGLGQLSCAAHSAARFAAWLLDMYHNESAPLSSLRVLLSPSDGEAIDPAIQSKLPPDHAATRAHAESALKGFRDACDADVDNVGVVYVAGHGVQLNKHGAIVLLEDFASDAHLNELDGAIDMRGCHAGMNHSATAQEQFWFSDACRQLPRVAAAFEALEGALTLSEKQGVVRSSPLFLSATTRAASFGRAGGQTLFNEALLWALGGNAAQGPKPDKAAWHVSVSRLIATLGEKVRELADLESAEQTVDPTGLVEEATLHTFETPPPALLTIGLEPADADPVPQHSLFFDARDPVVENSDVWPFDEEVDAGLYLLDVKTPQGDAVDRAILDVEPPRHTYGVRVPPS